MADEPGKELSRWADSAMYRAEPMPEAAHAKGGGIRPTVVLLNATPDPLGSLAALCGIYEGRVIRSLSEVSDDQRRQALQDMMATVLNGPLEAVQFHFLIEGVTRSFTHQAVRGRFAFYGQESMRFAVVDGADERWEDRQAYPPSLAGTKGDQPLGAEDDEPEYQRNIWDQAIMQLQDAYSHLVNSGMPAEEARGLMPHSMGTRYHWVVSLRTLLTEAGKRLCTQAQFEWRLVMAEVAKVLRSWDSGVEILGGPGDRPDDAWQFEAIADLLKPVCYQEGRCGFMAKFDRGCKIRGRVNANAAIGRPSTQWDQPHRGCSADSDCTGEECGMETELIGAIQPAEWLTDPGAAR